MHEVFSYLRIPLYFDYKIFHKTVFSPCIRLICNILFFPSKCLASNVSAWRKVRDSRHAEACRVHLPQAGVDKTESSSQYSALKGTRYSKHVYSTDNDIDDRENSIDMQVQSHQERKEKTTPDGAKINLWRKTWSKKVNKSLNYHRLRCQIFYFFNYFCYSKVCRGKAGH